MSDASPMKWVPLESSPEVYNQWAKPLGLPSNLGFQDVYSLDPDFLQYTPKPVYAVLLLFPSRGKLFEARAEEDQMEEFKWKGKNKENGIWWIKQTLPNACGSIGLLHSLLNLPDSVAPSASSPLSQFKSTSLPLTGLERARLLETSDFFKQAHEASQGAGQSRVPVTAEERETDFHFISFVAGEWEDGSKHIAEMDGARLEGPIDRGPTSDETFLEDVAKVVQEKYIDRSEGEVGFNLITLGAIDPDA